MTEPITVQEEPKVKAEPKKKADPKPETVIRNKTREINQLKKEIEEKDEQIRIADSKNEILFRENKNLKEELGSIEQRTMLAFSNTANIINSALNNLNVIMRD